MKNLHLITEKYGDPCHEDGRVVLSRASSLEFHYTKRHLAPYINANTRVLEIGCATGYYAMHFADLCREYVGVDINPPHIDVFNEKIATRELKNVKAYVGDAMDLSFLDSASFDVVLCLGPMYHLPPEEREMVYAECRRLCKHDGVVTFAYITRIGVYAGGCVEYRDSYPTALANENVLLRGCDDLRPDLFFFMTPEEINDHAARFGLTKIKNLATDFFFNVSAVNEMSDEKFELYKPLLDEMCANESCTGMANHALLICRKGSMPIGVI